MINNDISMDFVARMSIQVCMMLITTVMRAGPRKSSYHPEFPLLWSLLVLMLLSIKFQEIEVCAGHFT